MQASNILGHISDRVSSDCVTVDSTPPEMTFVGSGPTFGMHMAGVSLKTSFLGNAAALDNESAVSNFE